MVWNAASVPYSREWPAAEIASARRQLDFRPADDDEREFVGHQQIADESVDVVASDRRDQLVVAVEIIDPEILQLDRDEQAGEPAAAREAQRKRAREICLAVYQFRFGDPAGGEPSPLVAYDFDGLVHALVRRAGSAEDQCRMLERHQIGIDRVD